MKRTNYRRRFLSYIVISCVFLSSFLFYSPADIVLSAQGDPYLEVTHPSDMAVFDVETVEFTGTMSDDSTPPDQLSLRVFEKSDSNSEPIEITKEGQLTLTVDGQNGSWVFSKVFTKGSHTISFVVEDLEGNFIEKMVSFTIKEKVVEDQNFNLDEISVNDTGSLTDETEPDEVKDVGSRPYIVDMKIIPKGVTEESGYLSAEGMTQVPVDSKIVVVIRETGRLNYTQPLLVASSKGEIRSTEDLEGAIHQRNKDGDYVITFTPSMPLDPSTTYNVYVNPTITNDSGNRILPRFFKFTTTNVYHIGDIHGNYSNNTNACAYCHSTHKGETPTLAGGKYGTSADNYCMVCHDGTNGSPMPEKYNTNNKHFQHTGEQVTNSESCTGCHNPHASWTKENPARLQSVQGTGTSHFQTLTYKKAWTSTGKVEDFTLCFSCHDGTKASNIKQYYENDSLVSESGHNISAMDGSPLNGQFACADCHETHGSNNLKVLREELGNVKLTDADKYKTTGTEWTAANERQFCLKCHNNTTEVYGKTGTFKDINEVGEPIQGHQTADAQSCASCHGGAAQSAVEAAHAPKKGIYVPKLTNP
jgi:predicted CXXCH cytochrome family protein